MGTWRISPGFVHGVRELLLVVSHESQKGTNRLEGGLMGLCGLTVLVPNGVMFQDLDLIRIIRCPRCEYKIPRVRFWELVCINRNSVMQCICVMAYKGLQNAKVSRCKGLQNAAEPKSASTFTNKHSVV